jgi:gas vesicle protein
MKELIPVRKEIETICQETYNKEIGELSNYKKQLEEKLATLVQELADEVKSAQESNPDAG